MVGPLVSDRTRSILGQFADIELACSLHLPGDQWAVDLMARAAAADPSAKLRTEAQTVIGQLRERWESDDRRYGTWKRGQPGTGWHPLTRSGPDFRKSA